MRYATDAICIHKPTGKFVLIERLSYPEGLAFPGGGIELNESRDLAIRREMKEETGLDFTLQRWLKKVYDKSGRDPRGEVTSYVAYGYGEGEIRNEVGKTKVLLLSKEEIISRKAEFAFDHFEIFSDFLSSSFPFVKNEIKTPE